MPTTRQKAAARKNIKKAQTAWRSMTPRQHARAQPEGRARRKPGTTGKGAYYHVEVRPKGEFVTFRTQDVGRPGHAQRRAGKRASGSWDTQSWLIAKEDAHVEGGRLVIHQDERAELRGAFRGPIKHVKGDIFRAKPRRNVPEREKPTAAQRRAQRENIEKAREARHAMVH